MKLFKEHYIRKFVRMKIGEYKGKCYYINSIRIDNNDIYIFVDCVNYRFSNDNIFLYANWIFNKDVLHFNIGNIDYDNVFDIISKEEYIEYIDKWIDQVKSEMTKFEPD